MVPFLQWSRQVLNILTLFGKKRLKLDFVKSTASQSAADKRMRRNEGMCMIRRILTQGVYSVFHRVPGRNQIPTHFSSLRLNYFKASLRRMAGSNKSPEDNTHLGHVLIRWNKLWYQTRFGRQEEWRSFGGLGRFLGFISFLRVGKYNNCLTI